MSFATFRKLKVRILYNENKLVYFIMRVKSNINRMTMNSPVFYIKKNIYERY